MAFILAKKLKMTQIWKDNKVIPVTVIKAEPNKVSLVRTKDKDGYEAVQVALGKNRREFRGERLRAASPSGGQEVSISSAPGQTSDKEQPKVGDLIDVSVFAEGDIVRVSGVSKGRGFQGVVKRHGFSGGPKTHGQKNRFRAAGSIGSTAPQRVTPGRRMAGHMGAERVTIKNLKVVGVDEENRLLFLKGAVPGARGGLLEVQKIK
jgi:large subunit ribosomal protein L3